MKDKGTQELIGVALIDYFKAKNKVVGLRAGVFDALKFMACLTKVGFTVQLGRTTNEAEPLKASIVTMVPGFTEATQVYLVAQQIGATYPVCLRRLFQLLTEQAMPETVDGETVEAGTDG